MGVLIGISILSGLLAFFFLAAIFRGLRRRHYLRASGSCLSFLLSAAIAATAVLFLLSYVSYSRLTAETEISQIEFRRISPEEYQARLMIAGESDQFFVLRGNEWQMDAKVVTWTPPATVLGLDPVYQLDRLSGRYSEIDREQTAARTVHSLARKAPLDVWAVAHAYPSFLPGVDAFYGTATYVPMADGARFSVSLSRDALIARPVNERAREAVGNWRTDNE